ncbi:hypothetical protein B9Z55_019769 [Caenorhabditis nigoni]|uniref:Uncharacterized protein n=1 Tax=Caenorhabditis nigoni TaxID=1611254 RepID=A0A2G5TJT5_9PELO|nr:hypothetical protein B9Z55_019769 [Caenorhabditis nigoni]
MSHQDMVWAFHGAHYDDTHHFKNHYDFPQTDITSPLTPNLSSPLTPHPFGPIPGIPTNQLYNRSPFPDFYAATTSTPMVQYNTGKKSAAGRKPKEEVGFRATDRFEEASFGIFVF